MKIEKQFYTKLNVKYASISLKKQANFYSETFKKIFAKTVCYYINITSICIYHTVNSAILMDF